MSMAIIFSIIKQKSGFVNLQNPIFLCDKIGINNPL